MPLTKTILYLLIESVCIYWVRCENCEGTGEVHWRDEVYDEQSGDSFDIGPERSSPCGTCSGHGKIPAEVEIAIAKLQF